MLCGTIFTRCRDLFAELGAAEFGDPADEVAQYVGKVLVHRCLEIFPRELRVGCFGCMAEQPPAPGVGGQDFQRLVHEHPTPARG